jgi:hypothetical protein
LSHESYQEVCQSHPKLGELEAVESSLARAASLAIFDTVGVNGRVESKGPTISEGAEFRVLGYGVSTTLFYYYINVLLRVYVRHIRIESPILVAVWNFSNCKQWVGHMTKHETNHSLVSMSHLVVMSHFVS